MKPWKNYGKSAGKLKENIGRIVVSLECFGLIKMSRVLITSRPLLKSRLITSSTLPDVERSLMQGSSIIILVLLREIMLLLFVMQLNMLTIKF